MIILSFIFFKQFIKLLNTAVHAVIFVFDDSMYLIGFS